MLRHVIAENSSSEVSADTYYRSVTNEAWLADRMLTSRSHRRKHKDNGTISAPVFAGVQLGFTPLDRAVAP